MKALRSTEAHERLALLIKANERRKELEKQEKEQKEWFREQLAGEDGALQVDGHLVIVSTKETTGLDKKALVAEFGDKLKAFEKTTSYQTVEVKKI